MTLVNVLTPEQFTILSKLPPVFVETLVTQLTVPQLVTLLQKNPLPTNPVEIPFVQTLTTTSGVIDNLVAFGNLVKIPTTGPVIVTGIIPFDVTFAQTLVIENTGVSTVTVSNLSTSTSTNQFSLSTGTSVTIPAGSSMQFTYRPEDSKWEDTAASVAVITGAISSGESWVKITKSYSDFSDASTSKTITIRSMAAKEVVTGIIVKHSVAFSGGTLASYSISTSSLAAPFNTFTSAGLDVMQTVSNTAADSAGHATGSFGFAGWNLQATATSSGANLSAATQGSVDIWVRIGSFT